MPNFSNLHKIAYLTSGGDFTVDRWQGFEDTDLLDYMYHYSGKRQKDLIRL
jgi:hypothetical protein